MTLATTIAFVVLSSIALRLAVPYLSKDSAAGGITSSNGESVLGDCPDTPNCQGSESSRSKQTVDRFALTQPASSAITTLQSTIASLPGTAIVEQNERYLHATFSSRIMGYVDDVEFLVSDDQQSVQVRSASRLGKSDLGANAKRVATLRSLVDGKL